MLFIGEYYKLYVLFDNFLKCPSFNFASSFNLKKNVMKNVFIFLTALFYVALASAQMPKLAIIGFDATNSQLNQPELTELLRIEMSKHGLYETVDRYEIFESLAAADIVNTECYSKSCLVKAGEILDVDYMLSGSLDKIGESIFIRIRLLNMSTQAIEKEIVKEFLNIPAKVNTMISICINEMVGKENDKVIVNSLSNLESYESSINNPYYQRLNLSGPRMGYTFFTGTAANILNAPTNRGGFNVNPQFFQMGYQFEKQYLSEGKWQALVEIIPLISGVDQGLFIPSLTVMNGIRSNVNGLEFAIGPSINVMRRAEMFELNGEWVRVDEVNNTENVPTELRMNRNGSEKLTSNVVIAAGYSLRSGKLNIPINAFVIPAKDGWRYGISFGFNTKTK
jgi:TolB-like protein